MKLRESLSLKITAIAVSFVTFMLTFAGALGIIYMLDSDYYFRTREDVKKETIMAQAYKAIYKIHDFCIMWDEDYFLKGEWKADLDDYAEDQGFYYSIECEENSEVNATNYNGEKHLAVAEQTFDISEEQKFITPEGTTAYKQVNIAKAKITVYMPETAKLSNRDALLLKLSDLLYSFRFHLIWMTAASAILTFILLCYLYAAVSHRPGGEIRLNTLDKLPFDILTAAVIFAAVISIILLDEAFYISFVPGVLILTATVAADYLIALAYTLTFAGRLKNHTLLKNNLIYHLLKYFKSFWEFAVYYIKRIPLIWKILAVSVALAFFWLIIFANASFYSMEIPFFTYLFLISATALSVIVSVSLHRIKEGGEKIASGELEYKIDTKYMYGNFKDFAEKLNHINDGLSIALNEKMKSERFKTELITNVSHDIKTPLTSIINYVDLIKKEEPESETLREYIDVLDRQSGRLKKLIEDLVEASKASTGNISVKLTECEVGVLLSQVMGEFDQRLTAAGLIPMLKIPEKPVKIKADGRHLWRVFDNLMNNVCKYSLSGTRVYMDVAEQNGRAVITFRNISAYELNISSDELMERFVRGDKSRGTEGSGLGLSIAKSLTELQNGSFDISVDGDLFKVTVIFPALM